VQKIKCLLSVNINKIATLRNSRGGNQPNVLQCAKDIVMFGAHGITVHPRPDERHIKKQDVLDISRWLKKHNKKSPHHIEFNIEGYPSVEYLRLLEKVRPDQATLVPDPPEALTSNAGWRLQKSEKFLTPIVRNLQNKGVRVSLFIDVFAWSNSEQAALLRINPDRVELYTERFAHDFTNLKKRTSTTLKYKTVTKTLSELGFSINAGHDLSLHNVNYLLKSIPEIQECSIGHALISEALYLGLQKTIRSYLKKMRR
jgi:pyridoxine 5-phosphate synthase